MADEEYPSVASLLEKSLQIHQDVQKSILPTSSEELQEKIKEGIDGLIKTTVLVSELGVFSTNETLDELPTSSIKFLLLPVLLGSLSLKRTDIDRLEVLRLANVYFRDFIIRCRQYKLTDVSLPDDQNDSDTQSEENVVHKPSSKTAMPTPEELQAMARQRQEKIRRYKETKAIGERLNDLKKVLDNPNYSDDTLREYNITMVKKFIHESLDELESMAMEQKMLLEMAAMRRKGLVPNPAAASKAKPFKPILITRDALRKNVFGMGYPSHPSISVEDFYDQRVRDGWFPDPSRSQNCLQDRAALDPEAEKEAIEREEEEKEKATEQDNPEKLAKDRKWDEWRDTHRRGWGNTYNRS
ncbi:immunoglobulin-binding protein 1 [Procambarus clarkii]|uniref:immunoglobulin-binding protein 1 n=1 Tax=Procambarus clarkii TaxID=6728 RepID=UPI001E670ADA|nr:immunoglobulin-binding protein 1-like [Procambarus clarkii]